MFILKKSITLYILLVLFLLFTNNTNAKLTTIDKKPNLVIFIHGLHESEKRANKRFAKIIKYFKKEGYYTKLLIYNSKDTFENILQESNKKIRADVDFNKYNVSIIAHSMGGIVAHYLITDYKLPINNVVMISTPINGSELANFYSMRVLNILSSLIMGKSLKTLSPYSDVIQNINNIDSYNAGMIMAHKTSFDFFSINKAILESDESDGVVKISEMQREGIKDYIMIQGNHINILYNKKTYIQAQLFLEESHFKH